MATSQQMGLQAKPNEHEDGAVEIVQTTLRSESGDSTTERRGHQENSAEILSRPQPVVARPFVYPAWPTSQPGPLAVAPPAGQHPHPLRTDQMVYESYDQEKGIPGIPHLIPGAQECDVKSSLPDASSQDEMAEMSAIQRWLDDGGSLEEESSRSKGRDLTAPLVVQPSGDAL